MGFATGGYGNPGLNMLDNSFQTFYQVGIKLNWTVFDWNSNKKQRESILINNDIINTEQEVFQLNITIELLQKQTEINKLSSLIKLDEEITNIALEALNVDKYGLDEMDNRILLAIIDKFKGGPVGLTTIATAILYSAQSLSRLSKLSGSGSALIAVRPTALPKSNIFLLAS